MKYILSIFHQRVVSSFNINVEIRHHISLHCSYFPDALIQRVSRNICGTVADDEELRYESLTERLDISSQKQSLI